MYALVVRFDVHPQRLSDFDELTARTVREIIAHEPGTLTYLPTIVTGAPASRVFFEVYASEAAFRAHEEQPHVRRFLADRTEMLESFRVEFLTPVPDVPVVARTTVAE